MEIFRIEGGARLHGAVTVDPAKNAVLPILAACVLCDGAVTLEGCVPIGDVKNMLGILGELGLRCGQTERGLSVDGSCACRWVVPHEPAREIRSSIFLLGSILSRFGKAKVSYPGGCDIGLRPIDLHLKGLRELGVAVGEEDGYVVCDGSHMHANSIHLEYPSVGATENLMMAAVRLKGRTTIGNAAKEPEIADLGAFLNAMGAHVVGAGTECVSVEGADALHGVSYRPIPDRIEAGTHLLAAAITGGALTVENANPDHLGALLALLRESGCALRCEPNRISIEAPGRVQAVRSLQTLPYPGFATDLQAQVCALETIADGTCVIVENLFETRFRHVPELVRMGANITARDRCAVIRGVSALHGTRVRAYDLRGGAALVLAGLAAHGTTRVGNVRVIDRGYFRLEQKLRSVGARIERIDDPRD